MKKSIIIVGSVLAGLLILAVLWGMVIYPFVIARSKNADAPDALLEKIKDHEEISVNEGNGIIYMNHELIVFSASGTSSDEINALAKEIEAEVDGTLSEYGIFRFVFSKSQSYSKLKKIIKALEEEDAIESVKFNTVCDLDVDTLSQEEDSFKYKSPVYPNDKWNGSDWDMEHPSGTNWSMEAVRAPGAWAYLDLLQDVRVGLIDTMPDRDNADLKNVLGTTDCLFFDSYTSPTKMALNTVKVKAADHGTHVTGIMNGQWNNEIGVSGILGNVGTTYYCAPYLIDSKGNVSTDYGTAFSYVAAIQRLLEQDVQAINISQNTSRLIGFAASRGNKNAINHLKQQADLAGSMLERIIAERKNSKMPDFVICVAAGNANNTTYYESPDSVYGYSETPTFWQLIKEAFGSSGDKGNALACYNNFLNLINIESVKNRIIVVGSVGIDGRKTTSKQTFYKYSAFSDVGDRVDICAPGEDVWSCVVGDYSKMSGTSMATPHVTGAAGLLFAANPNLSGENVKSILCAKTTGRYYYYDGYSGLLNVEDALVSALKTQEHSVSSVIHRPGAVSSAMDLCFVVDTTGSMGDDIAETKENMRQILDAIGEKTADYRVALIDYRDFSSRTGTSRDYPAKLQMDFTSDKDTIISGINGLSLGDGGDTPETVYSGLAMAAGLDWRSNSKKAIIVLGDAEPLDPEPNTGYTFDWIIRMLYEADIGVDYDASDERVLGNPEDCKINVFAIGSDSNDAAVGFFGDLSEMTGGEYAEVGSAADVADAMIGMIEKIEVAQAKNVSADFSLDCAGETIDLYQGKKYLFSIPADENGMVILDDMEVDKYRWECERLGMNGTVNVKEKGKKASVSIQTRPWKVSLIRLWTDKKALVIGVGSGVVVAAVLSIFIVSAVKKKKRKAVQTSEQA